jgi:hypothetical protein
MCPPPQFHSIRGNPPDNQWLDQGNSPMNNKLKLLGIAIAVSLIAVSIVAVNNYLSNKHFFVYATGTNDKAFLNTTWKMSPQEIERANKTTLSDAPQWHLDPFTTPEVTNKNRFKILTQKDVFLFGHTSEVEFTFFDNMLYEYEISLTAYDLEKPHKEILETLRKQFGEGKEEREKRSDIIYSSGWDTEKQTVSYWMGNNEGEKTFFVHVRAQYKPFFRQIEDVSKNEKKTYF